MRFKDCVLITERKVTLDGRVFNSEKEAGFYLGSIGKDYKEIMSLLDVPERMAKWYASTGKKKGAVPEKKPAVPPQPEPIKPVVHPQPIKHDIPPQPVIQTPIIVSQPFTSVTIKFDSNLDKEKMQHVDEITKAKLDRDLSVVKNGKIDVVIKDETFAVAMINGKPVYTPEDVPNVPALNNTLEQMVSKIVQNQSSEVTEAFKSVPQNIIDLFASSKTFEDKKTFVTSNDKKSGGFCQPWAHKVHWGKGNKFIGRSYGTLRHEMFHMMDGDNYKISYKIPEIVKKEDMKRMRAPSIVLDKKIDEMIAKTDYGLYKIEADKILSRYNLTSKELEKFVRYDKSDTFEMKSRGAFAFALYLSHGDLTSALRSLYQTQVMDYSGQTKWVNLVTNTEIVYSSISDFVGSLTNNKVLGMKLGGAGHTNAYYKKRSTTKGKNCELIADYGAAIGCEQSEIALKILKAFAPYTVNSIETILKAQTYFKHEGLNVDYI